MDTIKSLLLAKRTSSLTAYRPSATWAAVLLAATLAGTIPQANAQRNQDPPARDPAREPARSTEGVRQQQPRGEPRGERLGETGARREGLRENRNDRRDVRQELRQERRENRAEQRQQPRRERRDVRQNQPLERRQDRIERREERIERRDERIDQRRDAQRERRQDLREERRERLEERRDDRRQAGPVDRRDRSISEIRRARTIRRERDGREITIETGNRRIVRENNRAFIQHDEGERFRRLGKSRVDRREGRNGRNIITVERPNGVRIISTYSPNGYLIERRRRRNGRDTVLIDNSRFWTGVAAGAAISALVVTLGEPRIKIPRRRYIVEYGSASDDDLYEALSASPVETFERGYALEQIRYSHDLRQRMRRIDLTEIIFDSGSWEVGPEQVRKLDRLARAIKRVLDRNPDEIFLIEGHTDAVGADVDNLSLSDRRAESVAVILTDDYGIPPENLVTQGYGEQYLAIETDGDEPRNRRVAVRRITPLLAGK